MKRLLATFAMLYCGLVIANPIDKQCPQHVVWGAPQIKKEGNNQYLCRVGYAVNYNYTTKVAYFVVETIKPEQLVKSVARQNDFREDPEIPAAHRSTLKDYQGSGLDRGHMAPAADFTYSEQAMSESFFLSNMMPQNPGNNRGIWKYLEENTRGWVEDHGQVYVITGTIFDADSKTMGSNVKVPSFVYKIIIDPKKSRAIAFMFPNIKLEPKTIGDYIVTIADIEKQTGINFSPAIPSSLASMEKTKASLSDWK